MSLSPTTIVTVKATVPALEQQGLAITRRMYERMFRDPAIRDLFNQSHHGETGSQPRALAAAVLAYAKHIDDLGVLGAAVERIAQKHAGLLIRPEHYPHVAKALLGAIGDVLGEAATPDILAAWGEAYWALADILIGREAQIYRATEAAPGGWQGWRRFVVTERVRESTVIASFHLRPEDGGPVLRHRPGQYLTFRLRLPGHTVLKRNYSISSAPDAAGYRITVKREPQGTVSGWLHDEAVPGLVLEAAAPAGAFVLPDQPARPVVLLSGGVGLTPLLPMLEAIAAWHPGLETHWVHAARDGAAQAFDARVREIAAGMPALRRTVFHEAPRPEDLGRAAPGRITPDWLRANTPLDRADYFLCGPKPFLRALVGGLAAAGVPATRIHYEFFGPADELLAA
ncbi:NO-inducible flavohemoprotein [Paracraurococcus ruber]|uniref:nitric oxide dioxygenase n=1 Tax=Paracraurococcus ruber TaxID=77675 RepID=A0ABS1D5S5_9PROT|nr:NO-inducible flavohemoprotein [Paracraurococcus ruber]MBK1661836.1 nitric oxide dioxygenase [Paracraurococcus ruber]TDG31826.1 NO-inducible flavohemoprotein [Paracraurococcus ruber]